MNSTIPPASGPAPRHALRPPPRRYESSDTVPIPAAEIRAMLVAAGERVAEDLDEHAGRDVEGPAGDRPTEPPRAA